MRVRKPKPFDCKKEYKPGERALYQDSIIVAKIWDIKPEHQIKFGLSRCATCCIRYEDCPAALTKCDKFNRQDRKNIYWRKVRTNKSKENG